MIAKKYINWIKKITTLLGFVDTSNLLILLAARQNALIQVGIDSKGKNRITARFNVSVEHPPQLLEELLLVTHNSKVRAQLKQEVRVIQSLQIPEYGEPVQKIYGGPGGTADQQSS